MSNTASGILFHGKNIVCKYPNSNKPVLKIKELIVPSGNVIFLLGASGCGKSTLLELLGLMNNTLVGGELLFYEKNGVPTSLQDINKFASNEINGLRKKHFSFIFQQTNLMENFTAYENVAVSSMIKENSSYSAIVPDIVESMARVKLPLNEVGYEKMPVYLSGGQRQRLSFVRAIQNSSDVLFCDEPTGNLDESNANELMSLLKESTLNGKTVIVVSHDINLALKYADQILLLTKNDAGYGELKLENIFDKKQWSDYNGTELLDFRNQIKGHFSTVENVISNSADETSELTHLHSNTYFQLFFRKELKSVLGKYLINFWVLSFTILLTLLSLGFANGSLRYLNAKMNSPFVNLVSFTPKGNESDVNNLLKDLNSSSFKSTYYYNIASGFSSDWLSFFNAIEGGNKAILPDSNKINEFLFRTIDKSIDKDLIREQFLTEDNLVSGSNLGLGGKADFGIIVTKSVMEQLGYPLDNPFLYFKFLASDTVAGLNKSKYVPVAIPVYAVVKQFPGQYSGLIPHDIWSAYVNDQFTDRQMFSPFHHMYSFKGYYLLNDSSSSSSEDIFKQCFQLYNKTFSGESVIQIDSLGHRKAIYFSYEHEEPLKNYIGLDSTYEVFRSLLLDNGIEDKNLIRYYAPHKVNWKNSERKYEKISVYFKSLDRIQLFADEIYSRNSPFLRDEEKMRIDLSLVNEKKNFLFLSRMANLTSYLLVIFSSLAVSLFAFFLLKTHLDKVKINLGTFKAMGLPDKRLIQIYFSVVLSFILISLTLGTVLSLLSGSIINNLLTDELFDEDGLVYFSFNGFYTYMGIIVILFSSALVSFLSVKKILNKTPGDLIYNR